MLTGDVIYDLYLAMLAMGLGLTATFILSARWSDRRNGIDHKTGLPLPRNPDQ